MHLLYTFLHFFELFGKNLKEMVRFDIHPIDSYDTYTFAILSIKNFWPGTIVLINGRREIMPNNPTDCVKEYERTLRKIQNAYHSQCIFRHNPPIDNLRFCFSENGALTSRFVFSGEHQGYDGIVHGGIIAAIIDASMAQCCMGHGFIAYTTDLSIRYHKPVKIDTSTSLETRIVEKAREVLFSLECRITQEGRLHVEAKGRFFKTWPPPSGNTMV
jgi:uncharacterized protein (TIGR00369 family)